MLSKRLCIYPKDVQRITGKSESFGRLLLQRIKNANGKEKHLNDKSLYRFNWQKFKIILFKLF
jgi:hypothetical protein